MSEKLRPFHLAFPVRDIKEAREWYTEVLGCKVGRSSKDWVDLNMFGHQVVAHLKNRNYQISTNNVDGEEISVRHFGVILIPKEWNKLRENLKNKNIKFLVEPQTRFEGSKGEQKTMFICDPSDNILEFKSFEDDNMIFQT